MKDLNRIKLVFVENKKRVNGWQNNCARTLVQSLNDVPTPLNLLKMADLLEGDIFLRV